MAHTVDDQEDAAKFEDSQRLSEQLLSASGKGLAKLVSLLLGRRADVDHARMDGWTPLMAACSSGHFATVEELLLHKADVCSSATDGFTSLLEACTNGYTNVVELLLQHDARVSQAACDGTTPLILASMRGHAETAASLVRHRADITQSRPDGFTAFRAACGNGHSVVASLLMEHHARDVPLDSPEALTLIEGSAALASACANGHVATAQLLLEKRVSANSVAIDGSPALLQASVAGRRDVASLLISYGADVENVLEHARRTNLPGVRRLLGRVRTTVNSASTVTSRGQSSETRDIDELVRIVEGHPLSEAATSPSARSVKRARARERERKGGVSFTCKNDSLESGPIDSTIDDNSAPSPSGAAAAAISIDLSASVPHSVAMPSPSDEAMWPAHASVGKGVINLKDATIDQLLATSHSPIGRTAANTHGTSDVDTASSISPLSSSNMEMRLSRQLLKACTKGLEDLVRLLLERQADAGQPQEDGGATPLMAACSNGHDAVAELLLSHGADPRVAASDSFSPLLEACTYGHSKVAQLLLERRSETSATAADGTTSLILASLHGHLDTVTLLLGHRADAAYQRPGGFSALRAACGNGHEMVTKILYEQGAAASDGEAIEGLISACANGQLAVTRFLLEASVPPTSTSVDGTTALMKACLAGHRDVASLLVSSCADVDAVLDAARHQNSLSGVKRLLNRVKRPSRPPTEETRDIDELVLAIEGPKPRPKQTRIKIAAPSGLQDEQANVRSSSSSSASSSESAKSKCSETVHASAEATIQLPHEFEEGIAAVSASTTNSPVACLPQRTIAPFPAVNTAQLLLERSFGPSTAVGMFGAIGTLSSGAASAWVFRRMPITHRAAGTHYTIEVLCAEEEATEHTISSSASAHDGRNARIVAARCKGWPVAELNLIPLDRDEIDENYELSKRGISNVVASEPAQVSSTCSSTASSSLPDRDAFEEYAAWCAEARSRCLRAQSSTTQTAGSGSRSGNAPQGLAAC